MPPQEHAKDASPHTQKLNAQVAVPNSQDDFDNAERGFIAQWPGGRVEDEQGRLVYDISRYEFITQDSPSPSTVNPSLWRQAQLNVIHGLFEVAPNVWQVRGYDISNITFIAGDTGWGGFALARELWNAAFIRLDFCFGWSQVGIDGLVSSGCSAWGDDRPDHGGHVCRGGCD